MVEQRPWDKDSGYCGSYAIALDALVKEAKPDRFRRQTRPALFDILKVKLPPSLFDYTLEVLKDAIMKYQDPYGHVSQLDKVEFDRCECIDKNGRPINHRKCVLPAVCIKKVIYTQGEATRACTVSVSVFPRPTRSRRLHTSLHITPSTQRRSCDGVGSMASRWTSRRDAVGRRETRSCWPCCDGVLVLY